MKSGEIQPRINPACEALAHFYFRGNIVPNLWYRRIKRKSGKPDSIAVPILADIVYWYRPSEIRDESTSRSTGFKQKFKGHRLQKSYGEYVKLFGFSKRQVRSAINNLIRLGLIVREFRHITLDSGHPLTNVMYLEPVVPKVLEISFFSGYDKKTSHGLSKKEGTIEQKSAGPCGGKNREGLPGKCNRTCITTAITADTTTAGAFPDDRRVCPNCPNCPIAVIDPAAAAMTESEIDALVKQLPEAAVVSPERAGWLEKAVQQYGTPYVREKIAYANDHVKKPGKYWTYLGKALECNYGACYLSDQQAREKAGGSEKGDGNTPQVQLDKAFLDLSPETRDDMVNEFVKSAPDHAVRMATELGNEKIMQLSSFRAFARERLTTNS